MCDDKLSAAVIEALEEKGWRFTQTGPNEWTWIKYRTHEIAEAFAGDQTWSKDLSEILMARAVPC